MAGRRMSPTLVRVEGLNTNLDLNGAVSPRVRPRVGVWAPADVPTTGQKRRQRWLATLVFVAAVLAITAFGFFAYLQLRG